jgi:hypothetical protein
MTVTPSGTEWELTLCESLAQAERRAYPQVWSAEENSMSIRKMISLHPNVVGHVNQPLSDAAHHLMYCARMCVGCADACAAEKMDMRDCIRSCSDCADICEAAGKLAVRFTDSNAQVLRETLELCARVCDSCATICEKYASEHEHCRLCAQMCRECAEDCRNAALSLMEVA